MEGMGGLIEFFRLSRRQGVIVSVCVCVKREEAGVMCCVGGNKNFTQECQLVSELGEH